MGEIIVVASQKGGVGKTSTVINLGASLAIFGKKVLLVDLDPQGSVATNFLFDENNVKYGLYDVIINKIPLALTITDIGLENLEIVSANVRNEMEEIDLFTHCLQTHIIKSILKPVKRDYDYIILDCPPSLGTLTINGIISADSIVIPVQAEYFAIKALGKFLKTIKTIGMKHNPELKIKGILITMFDSRIKKSNEILTELRDSFEDLIFNTLIPRNSKIAEAPYQGKPVALVDMSSKGAINYFRLAEELLSKS